MTTIDDVSALRPCDTKMEVHQPLVLHARVVAGAGGGPEKTILNSPRYLRRRGYRSTCLYLRRPGDADFEIIRQRAAEHEAPLAVIDDRAAWDWRIAPRALELCRRENVAIWHGHDYKSNLLGLLVHRQWPMRLVTTVHGWVHHTWRTPLYYALDRWTLPRYERVICVSEDLTSECRRCGVTDDRLIHIHNAINVAQFARRRSTAAAKEALGWPPKRLLIAAVGRLSEEKGFDLLIDAVGRLAAADRDIGLAIAGDGPQRAKLEHRIRERGLTDRVRMLGFQAEPTLLYEAADVYALSSRREGLPNVLLEAMAMGVPVVATRVAGVPSLVEDGVNGLLMPPGSVEALAEAIARLVDDQLLRERLAEAGARTVLQNYSFDVRMDKVVAVYDELLMSAPRYGART